MLIKLNTNNKKLLQQCGANERKANMAFNNNQQTVAKEYISKANSKLRQIAKNFKIDTKKYLVAPSIGYKYLVLIEK